MCGRIDASPSQVQEDFDGTVGNASAVLTRQEMDHAHSIISKTDAKVSRSPVKKMVSNQAYARATTTKASTQLLLRWPVVNECDVSE